MPGNPLVRFDEGRVGRTARCSPSLLLYGRMALSSLHRQTGNRHRVAPQGISTVLDLESSPRRTLPPAGVEGDP